MIAGTVNSSMQQVLLEPKTIKVMIYKSDALIEGWYCVREQNMCALLLPPHPGLGGTINNSILHLMEKAFGESGFTTLRINFRGVGMSRGNTKGRGLDLQDSLHALDWLSVRHGDPKILWVGGFAYGAHLAINVAMRRPGVHGFAAVTPYAENGEFNVLTPCPNGIILAGSNDRVISTEKMNKISLELTSQKGCSIKYRQIEGADHNYSEHRQALSAAIEEYVTKIISPEKAVKKVA